MPVQNKTDAPSKSTGNAAAAIDALKYILDQIDNNPDKLSAGDLLCIIGDKAEAALKEPPRQCDVGTAEEQSKRFHSYCLEHNSACDVDMECCRCPLEKVKARCELAWAQIPYKSEEGGTI